MKNIKQRITEHLTETLYRDHDAALTQEGVMLLSNALAHIQRLERACDPIYRYSEAVSGLPGPTVVTNGYRASAGVRLTVDDVKAVALAVDLGDM